MVSRVREDDMRAPKSVVENDSSMSEELKAERLALTRLVFDKSVPDDVVAVKVADFNRRWLTAGGLQASTLIGRR